MTGIGRVKFQQKEYAEAADLLQSAIATDSQSREAHYYLGLTDARLGKKEDSEKELQIASQLEHAEIEKHRNILRIVDPSDVQVPADATNP